MSQIGFVILTHHKPHQTLRLVNRLNTMFDNPPIVIHHDFSKSSLSEEAFPSNASFIHPHVNTGWGNYSIVEITTLGLAQMYQRPDAPDWCTLLSGACYPVKPASRILDELTTGGYDAYINGRKVGLDSLETEWHRVRYERYCVKRFRIPSVDKRLRPKKRILSLPNAIGRYLLPFTDSFRCYGGGHWFTANRRAAEYILEFQNTPEHEALARHYRWPVPFPEESYFQTVLYNNPEFRLSHDNLRYIDWSGIRPPKQLHLSDLEAIQASTAHFARKNDIDTDADLLDALDQIIDCGTRLTVPVASASGSHQEQP